MLIATCTFVFYASAAVLSFRGASLAWLALPLSAKAVLLICFNCSFDEAKDDELALLAKFWKVFLYAVLCAQHVTLGLKLAGAIECDYQQAFWVYWVFLALTAVVALFAALFALWAGLAAVFLTVFRRETRQFLLHCTSLIALVTLAASSVFVFGGLLLAVDSVLVGAEDASAALLLKGLEATLLLLGIAALAITLRQQLAQKLLWAVCESGEADEPELARNFAAKASFALRARPAEEVGAPRFLQRFTSTYFKALESISLGSRDRSSGRRPHASRSVCPQRADLEGGTPFALSLHLRNSFATTREEEPLSASALLCNVCFGAETDAVFAPCGHGGICLECAEEVWRVSGECFLCRQAIELILRYNNDDRRGDKLRIVEVYQQGGEGDAAQAALSV